MAHTYRGQERRQLRERRVRRHALSPKIVALKPPRIDPATRPVAKNQLEPGAVVLAGVDFIEGAHVGRKVRPVVIIGGPMGRRGATWQAVQITSSASRRGFVGFGEIRFDTDAAGIKRGRSVINVARVVELTAADVYEVKGRTSGPTTWLHSPVLVECSTCGAHRQTPSLLSADARNGPRPHRLNLS